MKFVVDREALLGALQKVQSVVERKNTIQILGNILCVVKDNQLSLAGTDLEVGVKVTFPVEVQDEGKITLSAKNFVDIVKELPNGPVKLTRKDNDWVEIVSGKSRFNVVSLPADDYPMLPAFEEKEYFQARVATLLEMIDKTQFAVSTDATRYHLNGVYFEKLENNVMRMTACDGHRLSFVDSEVFLKMPEFRRGLIIPKKGLGELRKVLEEASADGAQAIDLSFEKGHIFAHGKETNAQGQSDVYLFVRLIEGEYPDYRQVIPKNVDQSVKLNRDEFTAALRRVSLLAHEKSKGVKLQFSPAKEGDSIGSLVITSSNPDMGDAREEMDVEYGGEPQEISFNARYLLDCLPAIPSSTLEFKFKDRLSPGVLHGAEQKNHTYIVMPMRI